MEFFLDQEENIYSRTWELWTVSDSLSSSPSNAHKDHCPKKDISDRVLIVYQTEADRIRVRRLQ